MAAHLLAQMQHDLKTRYGCMPGRPRFADGPATHQPPHGGAVFEAAGAGLNKSALQVAFELAFKVAFKVAKFPA
jgi:hypothetical protein